MLIFRFFCIVSGWQGQFIQQIPSAGQPIDTYQQYPNGIYQATYQQPAFETNTFYTGAVQVLTPTNARPPRYVKQKCFVTKSLIVFVVVCQTNRAKWCHPGLTQTTRTPLVLARPIRDNNSLNNQTLISNKRPIATGNSFKSTTNSTPTTLPTTKDRSRDLAR